MSEHELNLLLNYQLQLANIFQTSDAIVLTSTLTPYAYPHFASELIHPLSGKIPAKVIYLLEKFCVCTWPQSKKVDNRHNRLERFFLLFHILSDLLLTF